MIATASTPMETGWNETLGYFVRSSSVIGLRDHGDLHAAVAQHAEIPPVLPPWVSTWICMPFLARRISAASVTTGLTVVEPLIRSAAATTEGNTSSSTRARSTKLR